MKIYIDALWSREVRLYDAPWRAYIHTKKNVWLVGLGPGGKSQRRDPDGQYRDTWRWITKHPKDQP